MGGSTFAKVFASINNASKPDGEMPETKGTLVVRLILTGTGLAGIILKDDLPETPRESTLANDRSVKAETSNVSRKKKCSKYVEIIYEV